MKIIRKNSVGDFRCCPKNLKRSVAGVMILLLCVWFDLAGAQESGVRFEHFSLDEGLSQSIVAVIHKDRRGFMWFGTESGLNKFDGYQFTVYKYNPFDSTSISNNQILAIHEDHKGNLWLGTAGGGLNCFDPITETFRHFMHDANDSTSLGNDVVFFVAEDRGGNIFVATLAGGIDRLDQKTGKFIHYRHHKNDPNSLSDDRITTALEDQAGRGWVGTIAGLNLYDREHDHFIRYQHDPRNDNSLNFDFVLSLYEAPSEPDVLWIGTGNPQDLTRGGGLNQLDIKTGRFTHFKHDPANPNSISSDVVGTILEDSDKIMWICTAQGLNRLDRSTDTFTRFLPNPQKPNDLSNAIRSLTEDIRGAFWLTTLANNGVYSFDRNTLSFTHFEHNPSDPNSLSNNIIQSVFEDTTGVLWLGTNTGGINKLDHFAHKFKLYTHDPNNANSLSQNVARAICEDHQGQLWVGVARGGLNKFDRDRQQVTHYYFDPNNPNSLSSDDVWSIFEDRDNTLWIGTFGRGLNRFNPETGTFTRFVNQPDNPSSLGNNFVRVIYEDSYGTLWVGTDGRGLEKVNRKTATFRHYFNDPSDPNSISNNAVRAIVEDQSGVLWIGTFGGGLNKLVLAVEQALPEIAAPVQSGTEVKGQTKELFKHYTYDQNDTNSLSNNSIQSLYVDDEGIIWIGTFGGGLNRFDPKTEKFKHFTEQNSDLPNNVIYGVIGDDKGDIWLSSNRGISRYNPKSDTFENYDVYDGLQSKEFNGQSCFRSRSGELFFGGINGFNAFFPDSLRKNPYPPQVAITDFKLFGKTVKPGVKSPIKKHISETREITLAHWQNDISFDFVGLHYNRPESNLYSYMLVNYENNWRPASNRRTATYTNLAPGKYVFRVKAANYDGIWNESGTEIRILVSPPLWRTGWAYVLYLMVGITLVALFYYLQHIRLVRRERNRALIREAELRAQAAEAQARAIQAENERKTHELEEARKLQLSMLPKQIPQVPYLDIAVYMQTATEVGGDYYDFYLADNGDLTVVLGDATGHGLAAGTMVSVTKSLFFASPPQANFKLFFENCSKTIKHLRLGNLYMALALARFEKNEMIASTAGMPPFYIFRAGSQSVEEIIIKGMPLGAVDGYNYQHRRIKLTPGDTVLLLSDGLPELFNEHNETFDYSRVKEFFSSIGQRTPQEIIDNLVRVGDEWWNGAALNDDVTFVVVKVLGRNNGNGNSV